MVLYHEKWEELIMMNIGKTIADLRKANNMTQSEVAELLGVSYQAVSKWERDESLPDITMLPKIADLYHISIDQLLRGGFEMKKEEVIEAKKIVEEASMNIQEEKEDSFDELEDKSLGDRINEYVNKEITSSFAQAFGSLAPMMKPKKIDKVLKKRKFKVGEIPKDTYEYLGNDLMDQMVESVDEMDEWTYHEMIEMLPMSSSSTKNKIVDKVCQGHLADYALDEMLPFLNRTQIRTLLENFFETCEYEDVLDQLVSMLPFLNHENRSLAVDYLCEHQWEEVDLEEYLPFLSADQKDQLVDCLIEDCSDKIELDELFPFMNSSQKRKLVHYATEKMEVEDVVEAAPFLNSDLINEIVDFYIENEKDDDISGLYPFMNSNAKKKLF